MQDDTVQDSSTCLQVLCCSTYGITDSRPIQIFVTVLDEAAVLVLVHKIYVNILFRLRAGGRENLHDTQLTYRHTQTCTQKNHCEHCTK